MNYLFQFQFNKGDQSEIPFQNSNIQEFSLFARHRSSLFSIFIAKRAHFFPDLQLDILPLFSFFVPNGEKYLLEMTPSYNL